MAKHGKQDDQQITSDTQVPNEKAISIDELMAMDESALKEALISEVEPFLDMDFAALRAKLIDEEKTAHYRLMLREQLGLGQAEVPEVIGKLIGVLAEIKAELQYLKAAYIESTRYREPDFNIKTPELPRKIKPDVFEVDIRGEITGGNWYEAEHDGRWAGPESYSSVIIPALKAGCYDLEIQVVDEIEPGIIDGMQVTLNGKEVPIERHGALPALLKGRASVEDSYRFPFWSLQLRFPKLVSPKQFGVSDSRILAIRVRSIRFAKVLDA